VGFNFGHSSSESSGSPVTRPHTFGIQLLMFNCSGIVGATCARPRPNPKPATPYSDLPLPPLPPPALFLLRRQLSPGHLFLQHFSCGSAFASLWLLSLFPFSRSAADFFGSQYRVKCNSLLGAAGTLTMLCGSTSFDQSLQYRSSQPGAGHFAAAEEDGGFYLSPPSRKRST